MYVYICVLCFLASSCYPQSGPEQGLLAFLVLVFDIMGFVHTICIYIELASPFSFSVYEGRTLDGEVGVNCEAKHPYSAPQKDNMHPSTSPYSPNFKS